MGQILVEKPGIGGCGAHFSPANKWVGFLKDRDRWIRGLKYLGILALGWTTNTMVVVGYNFLVYPWLIETYGLLLGWPIAVIGSVALCLGSFWLYDLTSYDWLGMETAKLIRDGPAKWKLRRWLQTAMQKGDWFALVLLSIKYDAFIATAFRRPAGERKMTPAAWRDFWWSITISNLWWGLAVFGVLEFFKSQIKPLRPVLDLLF